jgi:hypothetical protein
LTAKSFGEPSAGIEPEMSEWGNPSELILRDPAIEHIGGGKGTE